MMLKDKTIFVSGASRGIGFEIALRAARDSANIVVAAKTSEPHRYLPGTIHSAAEAIREVGGNALPIIMDVRDEEAAAAAVAEAVARFGGIDILVNNASAISITDVEDTEPKRWDLMLDVNARGSFFLVKAAIPHLRKAANPHVLTLSPPLTMDPRWFAGHVAYTISKYAMSMITLGMAAEFEKDGIAFNSLWPRVGIATAAIEFAMKDAEHLAHCRSPQIMADAAYAIVTKDSRACTGNFFIDDSLLHDEGVRDFTIYGTRPEGGWRPGMYLTDDDVPPPEGGRN
jgi:citronellol/citronellal dehydrogenase